MKVSLGEIKFWIGRAANRPFIFGFDSPQFRFYFFYLLDYSLQLRKCQFSLMDIFQFRNKIFLYILSFSVDWLFEYSADWRPMDSYFHIENSDDNDHLENYKMIVKWSLSSEFSIWKYESIGRQSAEYSNNQSTENDKIYRKILFLNWNISINENWHLRNWRE